MREAFICDAVRTPIGRYAGALAKVRTDDLAAVPIKALMKRNPKVDWSQVDEVFFGCANQAGEDNRNIARMALLLAGLPDSIPGLTINRLCASGLNAVGAAAQAIKAGEIDLAIAGGVESMTRAPFVTGKATEAFSRSNETFDTTIGWRFINPLMKAQYGVDQMPETGENVAEEFQVGRKDQDAFAYRSQQRAGKAMASGYFAAEIVAVEAPGGKAGPIVVDKDEHPRPDTTLDNLAKLKPIVRNPGTITAGNASGINDGAAAVVIMSDRKAADLGIIPLARIVATGLSALSPEIMGLGPVGASRQALGRAGMTIDDIDLVEINEAFAAQVIPSYIDLGVDLAKLNVNGGAIAVGHPFGMTGARITTTLLNSLQFHDATLGLETMCVGGGQGMAMIFERLS
jgi:3-oxoadipyl-CoA thiolase